jgi:site-specific DNA-adenine methylase
MLPKLTATCDPSLSFSPQSRAGMLSRRPNTSRFASSHDVVYLDPSYIKHTRKTGAYSETLNYAEMVEILLNARFRWILSEYEDEIYAPLTIKFGEPVRIPVHKTMNDSNHYGGKRPEVVECIWRKF